MGREEKNSIQQPIQIIRFVPKEIYSIFINGGRMSKIGTLTLTGISGNRYMFDVYLFGTKFKAIGAVYYISKRVQKPDGNGNHANIYIGQTEDLSERFDNHHKESCFIKHNANCISIHQEGNERRRLAIEADIINSLEPPCNG